MLHIFVRKHQFNIKYNYLLKKYVYNNFTIIQNLIILVIKVITEGEEAFLFFLYMNSSSTIILISCSESGLKDFPCTVIVILFYLALE